MPVKEELYRQMKDDLDRLYAQLLGEPLNMEQKADILREKLPGIIERRMTNYAVDSKSEQIDVLDYLDRLMADLGIVGTHGDGGSFHSEILDWLKLPKLLRPLPQLIVDPNDPLFGKVKKKE